MRASLSMVLLLACLGAAAADDGPESLSPEQAADRVEALQAVDGDGLRAVAQRDAPDPWLVADALLARGNAGAAIAFAQAARRKDTETLAAYIEGQRGLADESLARAALAKANAHATAKNYGDALAALAPLTVERASVLRVRVLTARGKALRDLERHVEAEAAYGAAARLASQIGWLAQAAEAHLNGARAAFKRNDWRAALAGLEAQIVVEEIRGRRERTAKAYSAIGVYIHARRGKLHKALAALRKALALYEALGDKAETAWTLRKIGTYLMDTGDPDAALKAQQRSLALARSIPHLRRTSEALLEIARIHKGIGHLAKAIPFAEEALEILVELDDEKGQSACLSTLGSIYSEIGEYQKSLAMQKRGLAIKEELNDRFNYGIALGNLGNLYARMGELDLAREHLERSLKIAEELNDRIGVAATLSGLGDLHNRLRQPKKALPYLQRAVAIARETDNPQREATCLLDLSWTQTQLRDHTGAEASRARVVALARAHGMTHTEVKGLWGQALSRYHLRDFKKAGELAHLGEALLPLLLGGLSDTEGILFRESWTGLHITGIAAALKRNDAADALFFLERFRAGALLEALGGRELARGAPLPPELQARHRTAQRAVVAARKALTNLPRNATRRTRREVRQSLRAAQDDVIATVGLMQRAARDGTLVLSNYASLADLQASLEASDVLLFTLMEKDVTSAIVVTPTQVRIVRLPLEEVQAAVERLKLHSPDVDPTETLDALRKLIVEPLQLPTTAKRVLVAPHGPLAYVPFVLLLPEREIAYIPSGTTWLWLRGEQEKSGTGVLALGDPAYPGTTPAPASVYRGSSLATLPRLPGTRAEVEAIGTHNLLGEAASEAALASWLPLQPRWRAVHFACHGLANSQKPMLSALALTPDQDHDGYLTCQEVFGLTIPTDLAVLSACDTGRGATYDAEGIVGFTRAFMYAGAPRVICSLWKVDDEATRALMTKFYSLWNPADGAGMATAKALKAAQAFVRGHAKWAHPNYWAAFVLWGLPD